MELNYRRPAGPTAVGNDLCNYVSWAAIAVSPGGLVQEPYNWWYLAGRLEQSSRAQISKEASQLTKNIMIKISR